MNSSLFEHDTGLTQEIPMATGTELVEHVSPTPMSILQSAVDRGLDADQLGKLMDLQERWERNQAERQFAESMHACQGEMPKVAKNAVNKGTNTRYANLEAVQSLARPIYTKHGFSLCYGEGDCQIEKHKRTVCDVTHTGGHSRRYHLDLPIDGTGGGGNAIKGMNAVQGAISTTSYGQRRLLCMVFNITIADEDDDGQMTAKINEQQRGILDDWLSLLEPTQFKLKPFLNWLKVEKIGDLLADDYEIAVTELQSKARQLGVSK